MASNQVKNGGSPDQADIKVMDAPEDTDTRRSKGKECCKKVLKFLFSHIGLCGMVIAYSVAGGFIFQHLEKTNEKFECINGLNKYLPLLNNTLNKLWTISTSFRTDDQETEALDAFNKQLEEFRTDILDLGYDGTNCTALDDDGGRAYKWSFPGALLFSVTVITTIGYGHIAPKTFWGRLVCIAYATLGIPLMLLCLANIGDVMADIFRFVYTKVCCCGCCRRKDKNRVKNLPQSKDGNSPEAWKNDYNKEKGGGAVIVDDYDDEDEEDEADKISVPLTITMGVIAGYIFIGTVLFGVLDGWDAMTAAYFCFVTISTIGFGDVVPGSANFENASDQWKMIAAAVYMLFGMAILSMCFSLIQEEIVAKFRWAGEKLGILEKEKPEPDDDEEADSSTDTDGKRTPATTPEDAKNGPRRDGRSQSPDQGKAYQRNPYPGPDNFKL